MLTWNLQLTIELLGFPLVRLNNSEPRLNACTYFLHDSITKTVWEPMNKAIPPAYSHAVQTDSAQSSLQDTFIRSKETSSVWNYHANCFELDPGSPISIVESMVKLAIVWSPRVARGLNEYQDVGSSLLAQTCCAYCIHRRGHHFSPVRHLQAPLEVAAFRSRGLLGAVISIRDPQNFMTNSRRCRSEYYQERLEIHAAIEDRLVGHQGFF